MLSWKMSVSQVINESAKVDTRQYLWKDESTSNIWMFTMINSNAKTKINLS